jgi:ribosomal protein S18 acetylase RimI-like enzyme
MGTTEPIRSATGSDCDSIATLIAELRMEEHGTSLDHADVASVVRSAIACATTSVLVAGNAAGVRGFIVVHWLPFPMLGGTEAYISDLIVGREARGQGVGRDLVAAAEREARARSCVRLMLNNRVAAESFQRAFYPKLGFRVRDEFANLVKVLR